MSPPYLTDFKRVGRLLKDGNTSPNAKDDSDFDKFDVIIVGGGTVFRPFIDMCCETKRRHCWLCSSFSFDRRPQDSRLTAGSRGEVTYFHCIARKLLICIQWIKSPFQSYSCGFHYAVSHQACVGVLD